MYICSLRVKSMDTAADPEAFYNNLKEKLYDTAIWPSEYLYKFISQNGP